MSSDCRRQVRNNSEVRSIHQRRELMSHIRTSDTKSELKFRHTAWMKGSCYGLRYKIVKFRPDLIFVDNGCFWHWFPIHSTRQKNNKAFWITKREYNIQRGTESTHVFNPLGWAVIRIWEHQVDEGVNACVSLFEELVKTRMERLGRKACGKSSGTASTYL